MAREPTGGGQPSAARLLAHLSLAQLRRLRGALLDADDAADLWLTLLAGRIGVLQSALTETAPKTAPQTAAQAAAETEPTAEPAARAPLAAALASSSSISPPGPPHAERRCANPTYRPAPLPAIERLWKRCVGGADALAAAAQAIDLATAHARLAAYRREIGEWLTAATTELVARYAADSSRCLHTPAPPLPPPRPHEASAAPANSIGSPAVPW